MQLTKEQRKQLVIDYNNGNGPTNLQLAKMHGISNTCVRDILIKEGVYKRQRGSIKLDYIPDAYEIVEMREQNRLMKSTLKDIVKWDLPANVKTLALNTLGKVIRKSENFHKYTL